jgi:Ni,Fe-hydrogenase I small subunit
MGKTLLWIESGGCSGESMGILGLDGPSVRGDYNLAQFVENEDVRLLWHPSLSLESPMQLLSIVDSIVCGREELTLFCVEGSVINGPHGTGMYDSIPGKPKRDLIAALCDGAEYVLAMGTCAAFGGIPAAPPNPTIQAFFAD